MYNIILVITVYGTTQEGKIKALTASTGVTLISGILFSVCAVIPSVGLQYLTFILSAIHRSFVFGNFASLIGMVFPMEYFGKLYGIGQVSYN